MNENWQKISEEHYTHPDLGEIKRGWCSIKNRRAWFRYPAHKPIVVIAIGPYSRAESAATAAQKAADELHIPKEKRRLF